MTNKRLVDLMDMLRVHLRANGWKKTVGAVPVLVRYRLGGSDPPATLPASQSQTPPKPADPLSDSTLSPDPSYPHRRPRYALDLLEAARKDLRLACPHLEPEIEEIFGTVVGGLYEGPPAPTHGDLKTEHLLFEADRVVLLDLDTFMGDDPLWDVARLSYELSETASPSLLLRSDNAQALVQAFVEEYFAHVPRAWRARLPLHYAGTTFKRAAELARREEPRWPERVESLLEEAQHSLGGRAW